MAKQKCVKCGKELLYYNLVLMMGANGFRRYAVCNACQAKMEKRDKELGKMQSVATVQGGGSNG